MFPAYAMMIVPTYCNSFFIACFCIYQVICTILINSFFITKVVAKSAVMVANHTWWHNQVTGSILMLELKKNKVGLRDTTGSPVQYHSSVELKKNKVGLGSQVDPS